MRVASANGRNEPGTANAHPLVEAELFSRGGETIVVRVLGGAGPGVTFSLWVIGTVFALLGAVVLVRRPDAPAARLFGLFAAFTAIALGVSPAAIGPHSTWALVLQFLSLLAVAALLPAFAIAFVGRWRGPRTVLRCFWLPGGIIVGGYLVSLFVRPSLYSKVRLAFLLYLVAGILAALFVLAGVALIRNARRSSLDARLALSGIACGTLPFAGLSVIPQAAVHGDIVPAHFTAIFWSVIPLTFAYAILRHQALGIRRLVHRGMVHGMSTAILFVLMALLVAAADPIVVEALSGIHPVLVTAALVAVGALLFHVLRRGVQRLLNRIYVDEVDSGTLLARMRDDLIDTEHADEVVAAMVRRLWASMHVEAVCLFLGTTAETMRVAASAGSRAEECIGFVRPRLLKAGFGKDGSAELRWKSEVLLISRLVTGREPLGYLVLGPKEQGEIFLRDERRLVATVSPILALAIRETMLLAELRDVSERLTNAEEAERARIARDLHDGPLQKALLLGSDADGVLRDRSGVARDLALELRELCARLRPAILDDLGLVPAIEWLLEQTAHGFAVSPHLTLNGMTEEERLSGNAELALFRVTQEALNNALKHGHATSIHVSLARTRDGVQLSVTDDGGGLGSSDATTCGLGIPGMRERLRHVGGSVTIASNGTGTMVTARIPDPVSQEQ